MVITMGIMKQKGLRQIWIREEVWNELRKEKKRLEAEQNENISWSKFLDTLLKNYKEGMKK